MRLIVESNRCVGCGICELMCMHRHEGEQRYLRIRVRDRESLIGRDVEVCLQCEDHPCIASCPVDALSIEPETGAMRVDGELCTGCGECAKVCSYRAISIVRDVAVICDLCSGSPSCAEACPEKVIEVK